MTDAERLRGLCASKYPPGYQHAYFYLQETVDAVLNAAAALDRLPSLEHENRRLRTVLVIMRGAHSDGCDCERCRCVQALANEIGGLP